MQKKKIKELLKKLFPINRSITGNGIQLSLNILKQYNNNIKIKKIRSGTKVYDWKIPNEWNYYDAFIKIGKKKVIDSKKNNLHLVNFSRSVNKKIQFSELKKNFII
jgi:aminopeptidase-like protein